MSKISLYTPDTTPTVDDLLVGTEASTGDTKNYLISDILDLQDNSPTGRFYSTQNQNGSTVTPAAITFNTTDTAVTSNFSVVSNSRITAAVAGVYNFYYSVSLRNSVTTATGSFWLKKNGVDIATSGIIIAITATSIETFGSANYSISLAAGDYVEMYWMATNSSTQLFYNSSVQSGPASPSATLIINTL